MYSFSFDSKSKTSFESEIFSNALKNLHEDNKEKTDFLFFFYLFLFISLAAQGLSCGMGSSSPTRDQTQGPSIERQSLSQWTARGVPKDRLSERQSKRYKGHQVLTEQTHQHSVKSNRRVDSESKAFTVTAVPSVHCLT